MKSVGFNHNACQSKATVTVKQFRN